MKDETRGTGMNGGVLIEQILAKSLLVISSLIFYFARNVFVSNPRLAIPSRVFKFSIPWEAEWVLA